DPRRADPEWSPLVVDPSLPFQHGSHTVAELNAEIPSTTIVEGVVPDPPVNEKSNAEAPSEVAEEDTPWTHFSHDKTFFVLPDPGYEHLLTTFTDWAVQNRHTILEAEWENGALPRFAWPSIGDRVWLEGRYVFDCGHLGVRKTSGDSSIVYDANGNGV